MASDSSPLWMISSWTHLPFSIARKLAHALSTERKVNLLGLMPACCICWKSSIVFSYCPALTYLVSLLVHEKLCNFLEPVIPPLWRILEELLPKFLSLVACTQPARRKVTNCWKNIQTFPHRHDVESFSFLFPLSRTNSMFECTKTEWCFLCTKHNATKRYLFSCACLHSNWPAVPAAIGGSSPLQEEEEEEEAMDLYHRSEPESHAVETVEIFFFRRENRFTHRSIDYNRTSLHCGEKSLEKETHSIELRSDARFRGRFFSA